MAPALERLKQRFSPTLLLRTRESAEVLRAGGGAREWLVARSLCQYLLIDCSQVPGNRRAGYVDIAVRRNAAFADPAWHVAWGADEAMVWVWSRAVLVDPGLPEAPPAAAVPALPESVLLGAPRDEGVELLDCVEGCEARVWRRGVLVASTWFERAPDLGRWNRFLRGAGLPAADRVPGIESLPRLAKPWASLGRRSFEDWGRRWRGPAGLAAGALAAGLAAWQVGAVLPLLWQKVSIQRQVAQLQPTLQPILDARERAESDYLEIQRLLALRPVASQVQAMAALTRALPAGNWTLLDWIDDPREGLQVVIRTSNPDPQVLVQALEESGRFAEAAAEPADGPDRVRLRVKVLAVAEAPP